MSRRIKIPIDNTPVVQLNNELKTLVSRYRELDLENKKLEEQAKKGGEEQVRALKENKKELTEVGEEITKLRKGTKELSEEQPFENMAKEAIPLRRQLLVVRREMQQLAYDGEAGSERFIELGIEAGKLSSAIDDASIAMRQFDSAGSSATDGIATGFRNMSRGLMQLDFGDAELGLQGMESTIKAIDVKALTGDFVNFSKTLGKTMVTSIKTLGKSFLALGKIMLANPLFLIASVIAVVILAIVQLAKHFEIFGKVLDVLMMPLNALISGFKRLTDWLGITNFEEQKLADDRAERFKEEENRILKEETLRANQFAREKALLQAKGELTEDEVSMIHELEQEIIRSEISKSIAQGNSVKTEIDRLKTKRKLTDEEVEQLKELEQSYFDLTETIKNQNNQLEVNEIARQSRLLKIEKDAQDKLEEERKQRFEKYKETLKKQMEEEARLRLQAIDFIAKIERESYLNSISNEADRRLEETVLNLENERKEILKNTQLTNEERLLINEYYDALEAKAIKERQNEILKIEEESENERNEILNKFNEERLNTHLKNLEKQGEKDLEIRKQFVNERSEMEINALENELEEQIKIYERAGLDTNSLVNYYLDLRNDLVEEKNKELAKIESEAKENSVKKEAEKWSEINDTIKNSLGIQNDIYSNALANLGSLFTSQFSGISQLIQDESVSLADKISGIAVASLEMASSLINELSAISRQKLEDDLAFLEGIKNEELQIINSNLEAGLISQEQAQQQAYQAELKAYQAEESLKKKQFEQDKKLQIAQATTSMLQGIVTAFSSSMQLGPILGPIMGGILAGAVGVMGAMNIAKIKSTKYNAGTPPQPPQMGNISVPTDNRNVEMTSTGASSVATQPQNAPQNEAQNAPQKMEVNVSISEINDTNNKVNYYESNAEL